MIDLAGKVFVITGGNGGLGLAMAEGIVAAGGAVSIWGRNEDKNVKAVARIEELGGRATAHVCDVCDEQQVVDCMQQTLRAHGRLDGLFANAGGGGTRSSFVDTTLDDWRAVMALNLEGAFLTFREAAKVLIDQDEGGSLVAVSSISAIHGTPGNFVYATAKTGLHGLVRSLAVGLARYKIRVNVLLPGWTVTDLTQTAYDHDGFRDVITNRTPLRRWATPDEFRDIGAYLADPSQIFHTGQEVVLDGGYTIF